MQHKNSGTPVLIADVTFPSSYVTLRSLPMDSLSPGQRLVMEMHLAHEQLKARKKWWRLTTVRSRYLTKFRGIGGRMQIFSENVDSFLLFSIVGDVQ